MPFVPGYVWHAVSQHGAREDRLVLEWTVLDNDLKGNTEDHTSSARSITSDLFIYTASSFSDLFTSRTVRWPEGHTASMVGGEKVT